ncbi:hypothetical protein pb186bvf_017676 [Paramecium bursaria]
MDYPLSCLSFSPNWFYPQIVAINNTILAYGANEQVFVYDWKNKKFLYYLQAQAKVTLIYLHEKSLMVGQEGGMVTIFEEQKYVGRVELNIQTPMHMYYDDGFVLYDERGVGVQFQLNEYKIIHFGVKLLSQPHCIPKYVGDIIFYSSGRIYDIINNKVIEYNNKILYVDYYLGQFAILSKKSKQIFLQITDDIHSAGKLHEIKLIINEKLPIGDLKKAPLSIKFLNKSKLLLTTRQGEFYIIKLDNLTDIKLDPSSLLEDQYYKVPIEIHLRGIFLVVRYQDIFCSVGIDRRISVFKLKEDNLDLIWRKILLSSKVQNIGFGVEKNLLFFQDHTLKALDLSKKNDPCYVNEFWKVSEFDDFNLSPYDEGLVVLQKGQKLEFYDIYQEITYSKVTFEEQIVKTIFISDNLYNGFEVHSQSDLILKPGPLNGYLFILMISSRCHLINLHTGMRQTVFLEDLLQVKQKLKNQNMQSPDLITYKLISLNLQYDNQTHGFISFNNNQLMYSGQKLELINIHSQQISCIYTTITDRLNIFTGCIDNQIGISIIKDGCFVLLGYVKHKFPIDRIRVKGNNLMASAKQHQSIQIWDLAAISNKSNYSKETFNCEKANIRGHSGFITNCEFYSENIVISTSKQEEEQKQESQNMINMIDISNNQYEVLPYGPPKSQIVQTFIANYCSTTSLRSFQAYSSLQALDLGNNNLGNYFRTQSIIGCQNLVVLKIKNNNIVYLVDDFFNYVMNLELLDISANQLQQLPKSFNHIKSLKTLNLRDNDIRNLESIMELIPLRELQYVDISYNDIEKYLFHNHHRDFLKVDEFFMQNLKIRLLITKTSEQLDQIIFQQILQMNLYLDKNRNIYESQQIDESKQRVEMKHMIQQKQMEYESLESTTQQLVEQYESLKLLRLNYQEFVKECKKFINLKHVK